jgi:hypothetical protein
MSVLIAVAGLACFSDGGHVGSSGADATSEGSGTGPSTGGAATTSTTSTSDTTTGGASASGSSTTGTTGATTTATTAETTTSTTTTGGVAQELLQHVDPELCGEPLWCLGNNDIPPPSRTWAQECYKSRLAPPLTIEQVRWTIGAVVGAVGQSPLALEVYGFDDGGPTELLTSVELGADDVTVGAHSMVLAEPIVIDTASFCVGLVGGSAMNFSVLGVAIGAPIEPDRSYIKVVGGLTCNIASFTDVAELPSMPAGSWCIGAMVSGG